MTPLALYREGKLREAIKALGEELRSNPLDARRRTFLFELFAVFRGVRPGRKAADLLAGANAEAARGLCFIEVRCMPSARARLCLPTMRRLITG